MIISTIFRPPLLVAPSPFEQAAKEPRDPKIWINKEGEKIPIKDLSTSHLNNIINMLLRRASTSWIVLSGIDTAEEYCETSFVNWKELREEDRRRTVGMAGEK